MDLKTKCRGYSKLKTGMGPGLWGPVSDQHGFDFQHWKIWRKRNSLDVWYKHNYNILRSLTAWLIPFCQPVSILIKMMSRPSYLHGIPWPWVHKYSLKEFFIISREAIYCHTKKLYQQWTGLINKKMEKIRVKWLIPVLIICPIFVNTN